MLEEEKTMASHMFGIIKKQFVLETNPTMTQTSTISAGRKEVETITIQTQIRFFFGQVSPMLTFPYGEQKA